MFGMNEFHVSASGAIQGHHGPLVVLGRVENIFGKGENAGYQHFLLFQKMVSKSVFLWVVKSRDCVVKGYLVTT